MSSKPTDLKTRLVVAATAALGLTAGCSASDEAEPAASAPAPATAVDTSGTEAPAPEELAEEPPVAAQAQQPGPLNLAEDTDEAQADLPADLSADSEAESEAAPNAPAQRRARRRAPSAPALGASRSGPTRAAPEPSQEVVCGASCGADCSGVPGDDEEAE